MMQRMVYVELCLPYDPLPAILWNCCQVRGPWTPQERTDLFFWMVSCRTGCSDSSILSTSWENSMFISKAARTQRGVFYKHQIWLQIDLLINPFSLRKLFCWLLAEFATGLHKMKIHNICLQHLHIYNWIVLVTHAGPLQSFHPFLTIDCQAHILFCLHPINNPWTEPNPAWFGPFHSDVRHKYGTKSVTCPHNL